PSLSAEAIDSRVRYGPGFGAVVGSSVVHVSHGAGVVAISPAPVSPHEADPRVPETVVNAAVEAHMGSPVAGVPDIATLGKSPVAGGPEQAWFGSEHPRPGDPKVTIGAVSPVARNPHVARSGTNRLRVDGQGRRAHADRDAYGNLRLGGSGNRQDFGGNNEQQKEAQDTHDFTPF